MTDSAIMSPEQHRFWNELKGGLWVDLQPRIDGMLAPFGDRAMDALRLRPGEKVLEIGCGTGTTTLAIAERVGGAGEILAADISHPMLQKAIARAAAIPEHPITFVEADAQVHGFPAAHFDAVYSRFGVMFFDDPVAAFVNIRSAVKPGGRLAFVCWADRKDNPWVRVPTGAARALLEIPPPPPDDAPGQFSFEKEARVRQILGDSGWSYVALDRFDIDHSIGSDLDDAVAYICQMGPMSEPFAQADDTTKAAAAAAIRNALEPYAGPGGVRLGFSSWIVTATA
jgi:SAM-dependent methyltransferase